MRLLVDISGLAYRSAHKLTLSDRNGVPTNVVFGTLRSLEHLAELAEPEEIIICWDAGHEARSNLYPEYKANRKRDPEFKEDFDRQMGVLREVLDTLPFVSVQEPGVEADDCIAALCEFMRPEDLAIVTGDQDLYQLASKQGGRHVVLNYDGVPVKHKLKPSQVVAYKVLVGDSSDNVKGVLGLGDVRARKLLQERGTLKAIMQWAKQHPRDKTLGKMTYAEALPIVKRNLRLIRLTGTPMLTEEQRVRIIAGYRSARLDRRLRDARLRGLLTALGFKSILRRFSKFTLNFKGMERVARTAKVEEHAYQEEVHQASQEGHRQWRRVRRVRIEGAGCDRDRQRGAADDHYIRRIRKIKDAGCRAARRWRRVRRVVGAPRRSAGAGRRDQDDGEGGQAPLQHRRDDQRPKLDPQDGHAGVAGAVPAVVRQARESRARARSAKLLAVQESLQPEQVRRDSTLSLLSSLHADFDWLKRRPADELKRLVRIIRWYERDETYSPSAEDAAFIEELAQERGMEMPDWMLTDSEAAEKSVAVADLGYWDFASAAIANMGRRR